MIEDIEVGMKYFVLLPGATAISEITVSDITERTILLDFGYIKTRYPYNSIDFVEMIKNDL